MKIPKCLKNFLINSMKDEELKKIIFDLLDYFKKKTDNEIDDFVISFLKEKFNQEQFSDANEYLQYRHL